MEWFSELIGFLIVLFIFLLPLLQKLLSPKPSSKKPEASPSFENPPQQQKEKALPTPYTTKRLVKKDYSFHSTLEDFERKSAIDKRKLSTKVDPQLKKRVVSDAFLLSVEKEKERMPFLKRIQNKPLLQQMIVFSEVLGKPKGD